MKKSYRELSVDDFRMDPVWKPIDDFEDPDLIVAPYPMGVIRSDDMYLVAVRITLRDGTLFDGFVRYSWGKPIEIALAINTGKFISVAVDIRHSSEEQHKKIADQLSRKVDDVFPLEYQTSVALYWHGETV